MKIVFIILFVAGVAKRLRRPPAEMQAQHAVLSPARGDDLLTAVIRGFKSLRPLFFSLFFSEFFIFARENSNTDTFIIGYFYFIQ